MKCPKRLRKLRSFLWFMHEMYSMVAPSVRLSHIAQVLKEMSEEAFGLKPVEE